MEAELAAASVVTTLINMTDKKVKTLLKKQADEIYYGKELNAWKSLRKVINQKTTSVSQNSTLRSRTPKVLRVETLYGSEKREQRTVSQDVSSDGERTTVQDILPMELAIRAQHYLRRYGLEGCSQE